MVDRRIVLPGYALLLFLSAAFAGRLILKTDPEPSHGEHTAADPATDELSQSSPSTPPTNASSHTEITPVQLASVTTADRSVPEPDKIRTVILERFPDLSPPALAGWVDTYSDLPQNELERLLDERLAFAELMPQPSMFPQFPQLTDSVESIAGTQTRGLTADDVARRNLQHLATVGYRCTVVRSVPENVTATDALESLNTTLSFRFTPGEIRPSASSLHMAIDDDGTHWFRLQPGNMLTRCGAFVRLPDGRLGLQGAKSPHTVSDSGQIPESLLLLEVGPDGRMVWETADGEAIEVGRIDVVHVSDLTALASANGVFFTVTDESVVEPAANVLVATSALESSNVDAENEQLLLSHAKPQTP